MLGSIGEGSITQDRQLIITGLEPCFMVTVLRPPSSVSGPDAMRQKCGKNIRERPWLKYVVNSGFRMKWLDAFQKSMQCQLRNSSTRECDRILNLEQRVSKEMNLELSCMILPRPNIVQRKNGMAMHQTNLFNANHKIKCCLTSAQCHMVCLFYPRHVQQIFHMVHVSYIINKHLTWYMFFFFTCHMIHWNALVLSQHLEPWWTPFHGSNFSFQTQFHV